MNKLEIAMVLDTTGSMTGSKISNLQTSATDFVNTMSVASSQATAAGITNAVKIAIVPFSTTVKVSAPVTLTNYNVNTFSMTGLPTWLDGRARSTPWNYDIFTNTATSTRIDRFALLKAMGAGGGTPWGGCVENRAAPYDTTDDAPDPANPATLFTPVFWPDGADSTYTTVSFGTLKNFYLGDGYRRRREEHRPAQLQDRPRQPR